MSQAAWVYEQCFLIDPVPSAVFLPDLVVTSIKISNESALRSIHNIIYLTFKYKSRYLPERAWTKKALFVENCVNRCFMTLEQSSKSANLAYAVYTLQIISKDQDWIKKELRLQLAYKMDQLKPERHKGFFACARKVKDKL